MRADQTYFDYFGSKETSSRKLNNEQLLNILVLSKDATAIYTGEEFIIEIANDAMIAMNKANTQVKRMSNMINGFLNIFRLESGKMLIEKERFDLEALIREIADESAVTATAHVINFEKCRPVMVDADRDKINSVVSNLISN